MDEVGAEMYQKKKPKKINFSKFARDLEYKCLRSYEISFTFFKIRAVSHMMHHQKNVQVGQR